MIKVESKIKKSVWDYKISKWEIQMEEKLIKDLTIQVRINQLDKIITIINNT